MSIGKRGEFAHRFVCGQRPRSSAGGGSHAKHRNQRIRCLSERTLRTQAIGCTRLPAGGLWAVRGRRRQPLPRFAGGRDRAAVRVKSRPPHGRFPCLAIAQGQRQADPLMQELPHFAAVGRVPPLSPLVLTPEELAHRLAINDPFYQEIIQRGKVLYARD